MAHQNEQEGKLAEAATIHAQTLEIEKRVLGPDHLDTLKSMNCVGRFYRSLGKLVEAETIFGEAVRLHRGRKSPNPKALAGGLATLGHLLLAQNKYAGAEPLLRECLETWQKVEPDNSQSFNARSLLGAALSGQKRFEAAEALLLEGYEGLKRLRGPSQTTATFREATERLVQLYEAWGKPAQAAEWKEKLEALPKPN
jgi:tetratricopeptide (TPR) repeat protein